MPSWRLPAALSWLLCVAGHRIAQPAALLEAAADAEFPVDRALAPLLAASGRKALPSVGVARHTAPTPRATGDGWAPLSLFRRQGVSGVDFASLVKPDDWSLVRVRTKTEDGPATIALPEDWAPKLSLEQVTTRSEAFGAGVLFAGNALVTSSDVEVSVVARPEGREAFRDVMALERIRSSGSVPTIFETRSYAGISFALMESVVGVPLDTFLKNERLNTTMGVLGTPLMELQDLLPLLIDMLRAVEHMERAGLVHGDLTEAHVTITYPQGRALLTDFRTACFEDLSEESSDLSCDCAQAGLVGSALWQAPELRGECAAGVAANVWQLGLIFSRMLLRGRLPTEAFLGAHLGEGEVDDETLEGREAIRSAIREGFSVRDDPVFRALAPEYRDLQQLLAGMLEVDPASRWTAAFCLEVAKKSAFAQGVVPRRPRAPATLPESWHKAA